MGEGVDVPNCGYGEVGPSVHVMDAPCLRMVTQRILWDVSIHGMLDSSRSVVSLLHDLVYEHVVSRIHALKEECDVLQ